MTFRNPGAVFPTAVFLSVIILSLGLGAAQTVIKELNFATDLLFSEQAYYAAESGVEAALIDLQENPVQHVTSTIVDLGNSTFEPLIFNTRLNTETFNFVVRPLASQRFRLLADSDETDVYAPELASAFDIEVTADGLDDLDWQWKALCQNPSGETFALQDTLTTGNYADFLINNEGKDAAGRAINFANWRTTNNGNNCFFSVQSLSESNNLNFTFTANDIIAPPVAKVRSIGKAGQRQKRIEFDYAQQNLGGLFDFVFFHWEG